MPSHSEKQRKFMGAELSRLREGEKTMTGMNEEQLNDFASKPIINKAEDPGYYPVPNKVPKEFEGAFGRGVPTDWKKVGLGRVKRSSEKGNLEAREELNRRLKKSLDSFIQKKHGAFRSRDEGTPVERELEERAGKIAAEKLAREDVGKTDWDKFLGGPSPEHRAQMEAHLKNHPKEHQFDEHGHQHPTGEPWQKLNWHSKKSLAKSINDFIKQYEYDDDDDGPRFANPGSALRAASKRNPRNLPCPTCGKKNRLTPEDVAHHYQCDECANKAERGY